MSNNSVSLKANAKINISLDILGRRDNGYHDLETIMQSVSLHDEVFVKKIDKKGIKIVSDVVWLPTDSRNICHKVANIIFNMYGINSGLYIELAKNIPACAGLGGGSSNAAAVIYAIKKIFDLNMDEDKMLEIGGMVGADVPFCIKRGTYLARGIGEILEKLPPLPPVYILLAKPSEGVQTSTVFRAFNMDLVEKRPNLEKIIRGLTTRNMQAIVENSANVLETVTEVRYPKITQIKDAMKKHGTLGAQMSGSGPTVFGYFSKEDQANEAMDYIRKKLGIREICVTTPFKPKTSNPAYF